jgi:hypothetical protein
MTYPRIPSFAIVFLTTSTAPLYVPGAAVCIRVFVKSNGCPTRTQETPPNPPDKKDLIGSTVCLLALEEEASISDASSDMVIVGCGCLSGREESSRAKGNRSGMDEQMSGVNYY